jgi:hypothetical protein
MKLLSWRKPKESTAAELQEDLQRAEADHAEASAAERTAWLEFRESGGDNASSKAHDTAKFTASASLKQVERLREEVAAANARELEAQRLKLKARRAELEAKTTLPSLLAVCDPDLRRATDALVAFADARIALARRAVEFAALERELEGVTRALGEPRPNGIVENADGTATMHSVPSHADLAFSPGAILARVAPILEALPSSHPLHRISQVLAESGNSYYTGVDAA